MRQMFCSRLIYVYFCNRKSIRKHERTYGKYMLVASLTTRKVVREQIRVYTSM